MGSSLVWIIVIVAILVGYMLIKRKKSGGGSGGSGGLDSILSKFFPKDPKKERENYLEQADKEDQKAIELRELLEAKKTLLRAQANNRRLQKELDTVTMDKVDPTTTIRPSSKLKH